MMMTDAGSARKRKRKLVRRFSEVPIAISGHIPHGPLSASLLLTVTTLSIVLCCTFCVRSSVSWNDDFDQDRSRPLETAASEVATVSMTGLERVGCYDDEDDTTCAGSMTGGARGGVQLILKGSLWTNLSVTSRRGWKRIGIRDAVDWVRYRWWY